VQHKKAVLNRPRDDLVRHIKPVPQPGRVVCAGNRILWDSGLLNGAPNKLDVMCHYYVGDIVTAMQKVALVPGGQEVRQGVVIVVITFTSGIIMSSYDGPRLEASLISPLVP
jgi:hypothetical protein